MGEKNTIVYLSHLSDFMLLINSGIFQSIDFVQCQLILDFPPRFVFDRFSNKFYSVVNPKEIGRKEMGVQYANKSIGIIIMNSLLLNFNNIQKIEN